MSIYNEKNITRIVCILVSVCIAVAFSTTVFAQPALQAVSEQEAAVGITKSPTYSTAVISASTSVESILFEEQGVPVEIKTTVTNGAVKKIETYRDSILTETKEFDNPEISIVQPSLSLLRYSDQWGTWSDWEFVMESYENETLNSLTVSAMYNFMMGIMSYLSGYQQGIYDAALRFCTAAADYGYVTGAGLTVLAHVYKDRRHTVSDPYYYQSRHTVYYHAGSWDNYCSYDSREFAVAYYPY